MTSIERIREYLEYKKIPVARAEKQCGFGNATLAGAFKNPSASIRSENLETFLSVFNELSAEWLLRGKGSMIKGESKAIELDNLISMSCSNHKCREHAYEILINMFSTMQKTFEFFGSKS